MKLQQLIYVREIARRGLNVSVAADSLYTAQPGVSKQVRLLEAELGTPIFVRKGKQLTEITPAGQLIIARIEDILERVRSIKRVAQEYRDNQHGVLSIATTHNQARYALPEVVKPFMLRYPGVKLNLHQGTPMQAAEQASRGMVDLAITTEALERFDNLVVLPCYEWNRCVLVRPDHALTRKSAITLEDLADCPIVTYMPGFTGRSELDRAFEKRALHPQVVLAAVDADVIKTYVRSGLGIGIVTKMAYDPVADNDLVMLDASHLFTPSVTKIGLRRSLYIRDFVFDFIQLFAPRLTREVIERAMMRRAHSDGNHSGTD